jgi:hypothetical protein
MKRLLVGLPLNRTYSIISYENIIFHFMTFSFTPTFPGTQLECKIRLHVFVIHGTLLHVLSQNATPAPKRAKHSAKKFCIILKFLLTSVTEQQGP